VFHLQAIIWLHAKESEPECDSLLSVICAHEFFRAVVLMLVCRDICLRIWGSDFMNFGCLETSETLIRVPVWKELAFEGRHSFPSLCWRRCSYLGSSSCLWLWFCTCCRISLGTMNFCCGTRDRWTHRDRVCMYDRGVEEYCPGFCCQRINPHLQNQKNACV